MGRKDNSIFLQIFYLPGSSFGLLLDIVFEPLRVDILCLISVCLR